MYAISPNPIVMAAMELGFLSILRNKFIALYCIDPLHSFTLQAVQAGLPRPSVPFNNAEDQVKTEHFTLLLVASQQRAGLGKAAADTDIKLTDDRIRQMSEHLKDQIVRLIFILVLNKKFNI